MNIREPPEDYQDKFAKFNSSLPQSKDDTNQPKCYLKLKNGKLSAVRTDDKNVNSFERWRMKHHLGEYNFRKIIEKIGEDHKHLENITQPQHLSENELVIKKQFFSILKNKVNNFNTKLNQSKFKLFSKDIKVWLLENIHSTLARMSRKEPVLPEPVKPTTTEGHKHTALDIARELCEFEKIITTSSEYPHALTSKEIDDIKNKYNDFLTKVEYINKTVKPSYILESSALLDNYSFKDICGRVSESMKVLLQMLQKVPNATKADSDKQAEFSKKIDEIIVEIDKATDFKPMEFSEIKERYKSVFKEITELNITFDLAINEKIQKLRSQFATYTKAYSLQTIDNIKEEFTALRKLELYGPENKPFLLLEKLKDFSEIDFPEIKELRHALKEMWDKVKVHESLSTTEYSTDAIIRDLGVAVTKAETVERCIYLRENIANWINDSKYPDHIATLTQFIKNLQIKIDAFEKSKKPE